MLQIKNINFSYLSQKNLKNLSFQIDKGEILAIIGESGCGKSTLLKLIYGLLDAQSGSLHWNEIEIKGPNHHLVPGMPFAKYLAQDFDLMPFTTVAENIGTYLSNFFPEEKKKRINELLEVIEMKELSASKVKNLSGGQMQRVALAKILAKEPELLLLDEPFSHIDNFKKNTLRRSIFKYITEKKITCIIATHDVDDVLSFSKETLILKNGEQILKGSTPAIYNNPTSFYVASLFGEVNEIEQVLVYPHQLIVVENSNLPVSVTANYFKGTHYLIETFSEKHGKVYFNNEKGLNLNTKIFLKILK